MIHRQGRSRTRKHLSLCMRTRLTPARTRQAPWPTTPSLWVAGNGNIRLLGEPSRPSGVLQALHSRGIMLHPSVAPGLPKPNAIASSTGAPSHGSPAHDPGTIRNLILVHRRPRRRIGPLLAFLPWPLLMFLLESLENRLEKAAVFVQRGFIVGG